MTHDELLQLVFNVSTSPKRQIVPDELGEALMAVLTLHKPINWTVAPVVRCSCCGVAYPCQTIQAIELNLQ